MNEELGSSSMDEEFSHPFFCAKHAQGVYRWLALAPSAWAGKKKKVLGMFVHRLYLKNTVKNWIDFFMVTVQRVGMNAFL